MKKILVLIGCLAAVMSALFVLGEVLRRKRYIMDPACCYDLEEAESPAEVPEKEEQDPV